MKPDSVPSKGERERKNKELWRDEIFSQCFFLCGESWICTLSNVYDCQCFRIVENCRILLKQKKGNYPSFQIEMRIRKPSKHNQPFPTGIFFFSQLSGIFLCSYFAGQVKVRYFFIFFLTTGFRYGGVTTTKKWLTKRAICWRNCFWNVISSRALSSNRLRIFSNRCCSLSFIIWQLRKLIFN